MCAHAEQTDDGHRIEHVRTGTITERWAVDTDTGDRYLLAVRHDDETEWSQV